MEVSLVFRSGDPMAIGLAKELLEANGIEYMMRNEQLQSVIGFGAYGAGYNPVTGPVEILVRPEDQQRALDLIADFSADSGEQTE